MRMSETKRFAAYLLMIVLTGSGCVKPYVPNVHTPATGYLVVEGNLNTAPASTTITLSRTSPLVPQVDTVTETFENGATVSVEGSDGSAYIAVAGGSGTYNFAALPLDSTLTYRLDLHTSDGKEYLSEYVPVIPNPPIDSANVTFTASGANFFVNTHNPRNNTHYYKWTYTETWEYHSAEESQYIYKSDSGVVPRTPAEEIYTCWRSQATNALILYSTVKLSQDVVSQFPLFSIPQGDQRLNVEYSLLVNQYALGDSAFDYFQLMQTNTQDLGSIFDPQPSSPNGNIHCVSDPSLPVVGYVNASGVQTTRIFVARPIFWVYNFECARPDSMILAEPSPPPLSDSAFLLLEEIQCFGGPNLFTPLMPIPPSYYPAIGVLFNSTYCVDCTAQGGVNVKPAYWP
jgi:hypothetical protein